MHAYNEIARARNAASLDHEAALVAEQEGEGPNLRKLLPLMTRAGFVPATFSQDGAAEVNGDEICFPDDIKSLEGLTITQLKKLHVSV